jgi:hypothetical protein
LLFPQNASAHKIKKPETVQFFVVDYMTRGTLFLKKGAHPMKTIWWSTVIIAVTGFFINLNAADSTYISISANGRYFINGNGAPWYWLGDTEWDLFRQFTTANAQTLCQNRSSKGFSALQVMVFGVAGPGSTNVTGQKPFLNDNVATPNNAYFTHIDSIVDVAHQLGLVLVIGIQHQYWGYITLSNVRAWARWIGQRYAAKKNIIWSMYPQATSSFVSIVRECAAGLQEGDTAKHLITVHPDPAASSSWINTEPWLSFNTIQTFNSDFTNYTAVASDYAKTPVKPVVNGEARYENEAGTTPLQVRNGAYWSICAGGFYTYGNGGNWMTPTDWRNWIDSPGAGHMKVLSDLMRSLSWWKMVPDQTVFSTTAGQNTAARSSDSSWILAYLPASASVSVRLDKITAADSAVASWVNPTTGSKQTIGTFRTAGTRSFSSPVGWADAVLLVRAKNATATVIPARYTGMTVKSGFVKTIMKDGSIAIAKNQLMFSLQGKRLPAVRLRSAGKEAKEKL